MSDRDDSRPDDRTRDLVQDASCGDEQAIRELLSLNLPRLRAFIRLRTGPQLRAREGDSDIVQSVCREVLNDLGKLEYQGEARFRSWLFQAALRKIIDKHRFHEMHKRDVRREERGIDGGVLDCYQTLSSPSGQLMRQESADRFEAVFDSLPEDYREVITLSRIVGLPHAEIAQQMNRSVAAVRVLLHRAVAKLGVLLEGLPDA
ncbi:MAG: sigma-70 family RNA polymerase sigma factor [Planctomycetes bacterium]|nr:sigma-70 family RNA polymerase sigma factor [Planctomycetota bacterium]MCB9871242.1 sigma-70 family RNA polymerase sigma factor [Planctomycetota bacterium]